MSNLSKRFLNSFVVLESTICSGSEFQTGTILFEKKNSLWSQPFTACLSSLCACLLILAAGPVEFIAGATLLGTTYSTLFRPSVILKYWIASPLSLLFLRWWGRVFPIYLRRINAWDSVALLWIFSINFSSFFRNPRWRFILKMRAYIVTYSCLLISSFQYTNVLFSIPRTLLALSASVLACVRHFRSSESCIPRTLSTWVYSNLCLSSFQRPPLCIPSFWEFYSVKCFYFCSF